MKQLIVILIMMTISLKGNAQNVIDVHCHNIPQFYTDVLKSNGAALDEGYPLPAWSAENHLAFMDNAGIKCSVLTMPAPQPYFGNGKECRDVVRKYNEHCAELKAKQPRAVSGRQGAGTAHGGAQQPESRDNNTSAQDRARKRKAYGTDAACCL